MTDSVTLTFRFFSEHDSGPDYGPAVEGVDYSVDTHTFVLGPEVSETDTDDILMHALKGQYAGEEGRTMGIGLEIVSAESTDPEIAYHWDAVTSETDLGLNWPAGSVAQEGKLQADPVEVLPDCPDTCPATSGPGNSGKVNGPVPFMSGLGVSKSGGGQFSSHPIRYFDGAVMLSATDLSSDASGVPWGVTRQWTNAPGFDRVGLFGEGTITVERPYLLQLGETNPEDTIAAVTNGHTAFYFDLVSGNYEPRAYLQNQLVYDSPNDEFILTDVTGAEFRFHDFTEGLFWHQQGQLKSYTDRGGNEITLAYDTNNGLLSTVTRSSTEGATTITEQLAYAYVDSGDNQGLIASVTLQRQVNAGAFATVRKAEYAYYDSEDSHGTVFNLKTVTIKDAGENVLDTTYYRYYTQDDIENQQPGYVNALKYVFYPRSFARLTEYGESLNPQKTPFELTDDQVEEFADHYFEYDEVQRVAKEVAQAAGCSSCTGGLGAFEYEYTDRRGQTGYVDGTNTWAVKTVETLPDGHENIVFTNYLGQVMLKVFRDTTTQAEWATFYRYDDEGRVVFMAQPSAVSGYDEATPYLMDEEANSNPSNPGSFDYLHDSAGLIAEYAYYASTNLTLGQVEGHLEQTAIHEGESGTWIVQSRQTYTSRTVGNATIYPIASQTVYENENTTGALTTSYAYTYHTGKLQPESIATTDSASGVTTAFYDVFGRATWTKDADAFIHYTAYDAKTGAVTKTIVDVDTLDTEKASTYSDKPSSIDTPTGGGLHLTATHEIDPLGRPTKTTDANLDVTHYLYNDVARVTRVYPGWNATTGTTTGPTIITREDRDHGNGYMEVLTTSAAPTTSGTSPNLIPTGNQAIASSNVQSLSRTYFNDAGQATRTDDYFHLTGLTYSAAPNIGTLNTNYHQADIGYDKRGRHNRVQRGDGTIMRTAYDGLGRPVSEWLGSSDAVTGTWSPDNHGAMVLQKEYRYDEDQTGDIGDSLLTSVTDGLGRITTLAYDFRGRQTSTTLPDPDNNPGTSNTPVYQTTYDNLGRVTSTTDPLGKATTHAYHATNRTITTTQPDPDGPSGSLQNPVTIQYFNSRGLMSGIRDPENNLTTWTYDGAGRMTRETNPLTQYRDFIYDGVGRLTRRIDRLGRIIDYEYDQAGRNTAEKWYDGTTLLRTISFSYDAGGRLDEVSDSDATYGYDYDFLGRLTYESQSFAGLSPLIEFDRDYTAAGNLDFHAATIGGTADFQNDLEYDELGRLESIVQQGAAGGNAVAAKRADFAYNAAGQFTTISRHASATASELAINTFYKYDHAGRLTDLIHSMDASAPTTGWGTNPKAGYALGYDIASRITSIGTYYNGQTTTSTYGYDSVNQLTAADHASQTDESYSYDENGNRTMTGYQTGGNNQIQSDGTYTYLYDAEGNRVRRTKIADGTYVNYHYDHRNRLIGVDNVDPSQALGNVEGWGPASDGGTLEAPEIGWGPSSGGIGGYSIDIESGGNEDSMPVALRIWVGETTTFSYWLETVSADGSDFAVSSGTIEANYDPEYGHIYYIDVTDDSEVEFTETFAIHIWPGTGEEPQDSLILEADIYDNDGTPTEAAYEAVASPAVEGQDVLLTVSSDPALAFEYWVEDVSAEEGTDYTDPNGSSSTNWVAVGATNQVAFPTTSTPSVYEGARSFAIHVRLVGMPDTELVLEADIFDPDDSIIQSVDYDYDPSNQLVRRTIDDDGPYSENPPTDTFYAYQAGQIVLQFDHDDNLAHRYLWNPAAVDHLLAAETVTSLSSAGSVIWPLADHLGTIRDLATHDNTTDATTIDNHRTYDSYGNLISETNAAIDLLFGFTGRQFDEATGLQNNLNRWYDPQVGRWISEDPIGFDAGDYNLYRYVRNSPTNSTDPTGLIVALWPTVTPLSSKSGVCSKYPICYTYALANASCFCKCAGDSPWSMYVRGCLWQLYKQGVPANEAHSICFAIADAKNFRGGRPWLLIATCAAKCHQIFVQSAPAPDLPWPNEG